MTKSRIFLVRDTRQKQAPLMEVGELEKLEKLINCQYFLSQAVTAAKSGSYYSIAAQLEQIRFFIVEIIAKNTARNSGILSFLDPIVLTRYQIINQPETQTIYYEKRNQRVNSR